MSKFQGDYTVEDMIRLDYSLFRQKLSEAEYQPMIEVLQYAIRMSHIMGKNIQRWKVLSAFGTGDGVKISTNIAIINKALATYVQIDADNKLVLELDRNIKQITQASSTNRSKIDALNKSIENYSGYVRDHISKVASYSSSLRQFRLELVDLMSRDDQSPLIASMRAVSDIGFFNYDSIDIKTNSVSFVFITDDVVINKGLDDELYMGKYTVKVESTPSRLELRVYKYSDNIISNGYYHPYVSDGGSICWGDSVGIIGQMIERTDIAGMLGILKMLLTTYSTDTTPWQGLDNFHNINLIKPVLNLTAEYRDMFEIRSLPVKLNVDVGDMLKGSVVFASVANMSTSLFNISKEPYGRNYSVYLCNLIIPKDIEEAKEWYDPQLIEDDTFEDDTFEDDEDNEEGCEDESNN